MFTSIANDAENATRSLGVTIFSEKGINIPVGKQTYQVDLQLEYPLELRKGDKFSILLDGHEVTTGRVVLPSWEKSPEREPVATFLEGVQLVESTG